MYKTIILPDPVFDGNFGKINKCTFYSVANEYNYYDIRLTINPLQDYNTEVSIMNISKKVSVYNKIINRTSNTTPLVFDLKLLHIGDFYGTDYVVYNKIIT